MSDMSTLSLQKHRVVEVADFSERVARMYDINLLVKRVQTN